MVQGRGMENIVLRSMVDYPAFVDEFLKKIPAQYFSPFGRFLLSQITELKSQKALNIDSLNHKIQDKVKERNEYFEFLSAEVNPNYLNLAPLLLESIRLNKQKLIGEKLIRAYESKTILDLDYLVKEQELKTEEIKDLNAWIKEYEDKPKPKVYPTRIPFIDDYLNGGLELAQLILISGDPEAGKTRFCLQILENLAKSNKVCFFCFEFTAEQYIRTRLKEEKRDSFVNFYLINDGYDIAEVANNIRQLYKEGVKFFLIDSQMRLSAPQGRNMEEEETSKFSTLAKLCHSLGIVIFLIIQTSKSDRDNPTGSKKGGHEASIIFRLERIKPEKDDLMQKGNEYDENARMFFVRKNKQTGKHPKEKILFDTNTLRFKKNNNEPQVIYEITQEAVKKVEQW